jgi:hypothetical protein
VHDAEFAIITGAVKFKYWRHVQRRTSFYRVQCVDACGHGRRITKRLITVCVDAHCHEVRLRKTPIHINTQGLVSGAEYTSGCVKAYEGHDPNDVHLSNATGECIVTRGTRESLYDRCCQLVCDIKIVALASDAVSRIVVERIVE